jgi:PAS domain S-box-containing protein
VTRASGTVSQVRGPGVFAFKRGPEELLMAKKATYKDLEQRVKALEKELRECRKENNALRDNEERHRLFHEACSAGIAIHDKGIIIEASEALSSMTGYPTDELIGMDGIQLVAEEHRKTVRDRILKRHEKSYDVLGVRKDGTKTPIQIRGGNVRYRGRKARVAEFTDIADRKQLEEALRAREVQLRTTIESLPFDVFAIDETGRYFMQNATCTEHWGDVIGKRPEDVAPDKETRALWKKNNRQAFAGEVVTGEVRMSPKGEERFFYNILSPIRNGKRISGIIGVNIDITDRKRTEAALEKQLQLLQTLMDTIPSPVFYKDARGMYTGCNKAFEEFLGRQARDVIGKTVYDMGPKKIADEYHKKDQALFRKPGKQQYEWKVQREDGAVRDVIFNKATIMGRDGNAEGLIGVISDITERKQAEEALRESEKRLRALFDASTETILLIDKDGFILCANEVLAKRLGTKRETCVGLNVYDLLPPEISRRRKKQGTKVIRTGRPVRFEDERDGMTMDSMVHPVLDDRGKVMQLAIFSRDITKRKKAEIALKKREAALKVRTMELRDLNAALKVLLRQRDKDKEAFEEKVLVNVKELVIPFIERLKRSHLPDKQMSYVRVLESNLHTVVSAFSQKLSSKYLGLTPAEIQIAHMVRDGKTTKEMSELLNLSVRTVETHRKNIRSKIGIKSDRVNLRSHLLSLQ